MNLSRLLTISRPRFWIYLLGPYLLGSILAFEPTRLIWQWQFWTGFIFFTLPANLMLYGVNDIFDYETDQLNPKKSSYEILVQPNQYLILAILILLINAPFIFILKSLSGPYNIMLALFIALSVFYSAPPIRAKAKPLLDSIFNILYVLPGLIGYVIFSQPLTLNIVWNWPIIISAGLWTMAMHAYSAIPDIEADKKSQTPTIATVLGPQLTLLYCFICYTLAALLLAQVNLVAGIGIGMVYGFMMGLSYVQTTTHIFKLYTYFPLVNTLVGASLFWLIIWVK